MAKLRVWRLGSLEHKITVGPKSIETFKEMLENMYRDNPNASPYDIIWNDAISVIEVDIDDNDIDLVKSVSQVNEVEPVEPIVIPPTQS